MFGGSMIRNKVVLKFGEKVTPIKVTVLKLCRAEAWWVCNI